MPTSRRRRPPNGPYPLNTGRASWVQKRFEGARKVSDENTVDAHDPRAKHWALMIASATEAYNKSYRPTKEEWSKVTELIDSIKIAPGGDLEESFYHKFVAEGIAPEVARSMAKDAAEPRGRRVWG